MPDTKFLWYFQVGFLFFVFFFSLRVAQTCIFFGGIILPSLKESIHYVWTHTSVNRNPEERTQSTFMFLASLILESLGMFSLPQKREIFSLLRQTSNVQFAPTNEKFSACSSTKSFCWPCCSQPMSRPLKLVKKCKRCTVLTSVANRKHVGWKVSNL